MKYLLTLLFAGLSLSAFSQNNAIHVYPWNPDANHNNNIGAEDLLPFLSVFGEEFGLPPEPCTYDGTDFEDLMFGIADGTIILDSIYIELELENITSYYPLGCPDQVTDTVIFSNSAMLTANNLPCNLGNPIYHFEKMGPDYYGNSIGFAFASPSNGIYGFYFHMYSLLELGFIEDGVFGGNYWCAQSDFYFVPLPEEWTYDSTGIHIESGWDQNSWPFYANYLHILPYWHYADE